MKIFLKFSLTVFGLILFAAFFVFRPVPIVAEKEALVLNGVVSRIYEGGPMDIMLEFKDDHRRFYINRGMEKGLPLEDLKKEIINEKVTIKFPKYWTPLDWDNRIRHISKLEKGNKVLFNELK